MRKPKPAPKPPRKFNGIYIPAAHVEAVREVLAPVPEGHRGLAAAEIILEHGPKHLARKGRKR